MEDAEALTEDSTGLNLIIAVGYGGRWDIVNAARSEIEQEVVRARESLRAELGNLIMEGTERVLRREVDSKAHNDLVEELVAQI